MTPADREALRQQMLVRALLRDARPGVVAGWMRDPPERFRRGLAAYQANAGALAERALAAAYPVLQQLLGEASFATMARVYWHRHPPLRGDLAHWGDALAAFVADSESLADEPCLPDVARLEWALHAAETAADAPAAPAGLDLLAQGDPAHLVLRFAPGLALIRSAHPVVSIWRAHRRSAGAADPFEPVRAAYARGADAAGEVALVCRDGLRAEAERLAEGDAGFTEALLGGAALGAALADAAPSFDFQGWLVRALRGHWLAAIEPAAPPALRSPR
jgi:hypothetical protein